MHLTVATALPERELTKRTAKYRMGRALRPFSFAVAIATCLIGLVSAWHDGVLIWSNAVLVLLGGVLLQAGVNLINDYADLDDLQGLSNTRALIQSIRLNFKVGMACFGAATLIGLYLVATHSFQLLWLFLLGLIGALGYTLRPINYKGRGLGVALVFWLMGVLMVVGSYIAAGGTFNLQIFWLSLPISCLVSLLLLSNEIRDYEADLSEGLYTLTARIGFQPATRIYCALLAAPLLLTLLFFALGWLTHIWLLVLLVPFMALPLRYLWRSAPERTALTPATGRLVMLFGLIFSAMLH